MHVNRYSYADQIGTLGVSPQSPKMLNTLPRIAVPTCKYYAIMSDYIFVR